MFVVVVIVVVLVGVVVVVVVIVVVVVVSPVVAVVATVQAVVVVVVTGWSLRQEQRRPLLLMIIRGCKHPDSLVRDVEDQLLFEKVAPDLDGLLPAAPVELHDCIHRLHCSSKHARGPRHEASQASGSHTHAHTGRRPR